MELDLLEEILAQPLQDELPFRDDAENVDILEDFDFGEFDGDLSDSDSED